MLQTSKNPALTGLEGFFLFMSEQLSFFSIIM